MAASLDRSRFPLVVVTFVGATSDSEFDRYLAEMDEVVAAGGRRALIFEASQAERPPAAQRKKQADWMRVNDAAIKAQSVGIAFVVTSPLVRGGLTAILWMAPLATESTVVGTYEQAERWAVDLLRKEGLSVPGPRA